jgi:radical SAM superfamily enzyme YgiQ (UPF0313 family)
MKTQIHGAHDIRVSIIQTPLWGIYEPPFALSILSSCLKAAGNDVYVFDMNIDLYNSRRKKYANAWAMEQSVLWSREQFVTNYFKDNKKIIQKYIKKILSTESKIISFSVNTASKISSLKIAQMIKKKDKEVKIIFGGHVFMILDDKEIEAIFNSSVVDFIVYGEGEVAFPELIKFIENVSDLSNCKGIFYKNENNNVIKTEERFLIKNLDMLPFMDFKDLPLEKYENPEWLGKHLTMQASRGCPWKCVFCGATTYWKGYRFMNGKRLYEEIKYHIERHPEIENVEFMDLIFNGCMKSLEEFCGLMIENPPKKGLGWHANTVIRPEMTPDMLNKMKKAGCFQLTYGIESGSQRVLGLMKKRYRISDAHEVLKATYEAGILIKANFMFGFPGETEKDFQNTLVFLKKNAKYITAAYPSFSFCAVETNSYLGEHMEEFGIIPNPSNNLYWESKDGINTYPERMRRWEVFSNYARSLGVDIAIGLDTSPEQHRWINLGYYYKSKKDYKEAAKCFNKYLSFDPDNRAVLEEIKKLNCNL